MTGIEFVYFDLDDTLLDHTHAEQQALVQLVTDRADVFQGIPEAEVLRRYAEINPVVWRKYSSGEYTKTQAKVGRFEQLVQTFSPSKVDAATELADEYLALYGNHWKAMEGAMEAFLDVASDLPVGILTNGFSEQQRAKLRQFPELEERSAAVVISEEVGYLKPHPLLFEHATTLAGVHPSSILYVGDSLRSDVEGGTLAGWKVAWFSANDFDHPDVWSFTDWRVFQAQINGRQNRT